MKPAGNGNKKRKNQWKKRRWQWKEACTLSWTRHSQKGVQPPRWPYPGTWAWGSNPLADPTPGPGWGDPGRRRGQKSLLFCFFFFCFFLGKKPKKKKAKKKQKKGDLGGPPPSRRGGPLKFPATFTTFPDGAAKSAKFPPNLAKVHVPRRLATIRGILFHLQAPKVGWHSQRKRLHMFFVVFFPIVVFALFLLFYCFFIAFSLLFYCFFVCFFFAFFLLFFF